ncbi:MAG: substrate-binding domain-containing protein [Desulfobacterales bacterium]|nr:substrate-binding domain-containing protein [Desulfobacterales bacterium]
MRIRRTIGLVSIVLLASLMIWGSQPATALAAQGHFKGIHIVFFPGGSEGGPFASVVYRGAKAAEEDLGCKVDYVWSGWLPDKMVAQFKDAIAKRPDGIAVMGHPGVAAYQPLVDEAVAKGIIVTSQNTTLPAIEEKYKAQGFGYVGQELYPSGVLLAKGAAQRAGLKKGDRAMVWGLLGQETRGLRTKGCVDALKESGIKVDYIEISDAINSDASLGTPVVTSYIATHPDVKLIIADHGALTATLGTYLNAARKKPGDIYTAGFDLSAATAQAIKEGWVGAVLDQQPWLQGYLPILQICLTKKYGFAGLHIDTGAAIIDKSNIDFVAPLAEKGIR